MHPKSQRSLLFSSSIVLDVISILGKFTDS